MKKILTLTLILSMLSACSNLAPAGNKKIAVLIVDGQNNHASWPKTTADLKRDLEESGLFTVDVARTKFIWKGDKWIEKQPSLNTFSTESVKDPVADPDFSPDFFKYDVVISNFGWKAAPWPKQTQKNFEKYVREGGGFVVIHAANNSFPKWQAYNDMIGMGGWGGRNQKDGPIIYLADDGSVVRDYEAKRNAGSHGKRHEFVVQLRGEHPITRDMPTRWMHTNDEIYGHLRGPGKNMNIIASAYSDPATKGNGRHEPVMLTLSYGKGSIFHTTLGDNVRSFSSIGFITSVIRGTEWVATGEVTYPIPEDFPTEEASSARTFDK